MYEISCCALNGCPPNVRIMSPVCNSDLEEFDYHDSAWDTEGFDEEEYKEAVKELLTSENEVSNPNDWEYQK